MNYELILGDCLEVMRGMADNIADAFITDPPYGIGKKYGDGDDEWRPSRDLWAEVYRLLKSDGSLHMTVSNKHLPYWLEEVTAAGFIYMHCSVYWNATRKGGNWNGQFAYAWEPILHFKKTTFSLRKRMLSDVFQHGGLRETDHPAERDLSTWKRLIDHIPGDLIIDPFMGSGTTALACMQTGRNFIGIEIDPTYHRIAQRRIEDAAAQPMLLAL